MKSLNISLVIGLILFFGLMLTSLANELPDPLAAGWQGEKVCELLNEDDKQRILRCTFEPGVGHEKHFHTAHFGYALSGGTMRLISESGTREVTLKTGSSYTSDGVEWHEVLNIGDTTVTYLIVEPKG
ncbi:cupin domain-containing protein [Thalassotalea nanhaiensis]|uniref:Cupin domain-containing protein n=1 Tax=Thalassotalea nanhaiensis TaxID=3065648 RepID=A0ABY9TLK7_9GAMM|nr:cupin domain-containing protein [Colwelliaceae bacterium SQ345]